MIENQCEKSDESEAKVIEALLIQVYTISRIIFFFKLLLNHIFDNNFVIYLISKYLFSFNKNHDFQIKK